ncbi:MAG: alpha/beta fold hydrolase [Acidimicrobiales bacterium]
MGTGPGRMRVWESVGSPDVAPPVVLVHGIVSSRYLLPTARWLAQRRPVVAVDLPGFGASARPRRQPGIRVLADALTAALGELGVDRPVVVGHSLGVHVVVDLAVRHPEMVGGVVLVGPTGDPAAATVARLSWRWLACAVREPLGFNLLVLREVAEVGPRRMLASARHAVADPLVAKLAQVALPALVLRGSADRIAPPPWVQEVDARLPDSRRRVLAGVAHTVVYSAPDRVGALVDDFAAGAMPA